MGKLTWTTLLLRHIHKMEGSSNFVFKINKLRTVLAERRAELDLLMEKLHVEGFYESDRMSYGDYDSKASGYFRLTLNNLTAAGLAILKIENNSSLKVEKMRLTYTSASKRIQVTQQEKDSRLSAFITSVAFGKMVLRKIWRGLTYHLNTIIEEKVNLALTKRPLAQIIGNNKTLAKYEDYIVTTTDDANKLVDTIIDYAKNVILQKYRDRIKIPDIREGFEKKVLLVTWRGQFLADRGTARGCHTVERVGSTTFANDNSSFMHFYGTLGFEHIDLFYDHYHAHFMGLGPSGSLSTKFFPLDLYVHFHIDFTNKKVYLDDFRVMSVGDLEVKLTGLGWLVDFLTSKVATWVVGLYRDKIITDLQLKYDKYISDILHTYDLDDIMEGKILK
ncbi:uncharacterized protein LOC111866815 isoform X2 [Cryptotermes secundus]|uniref:uncharacterized protein LOC111866815 isoform X2 n=1 Tax=Cryptotermes secundus TaxID=105785 RepID=UPI000CD7BFF6|nr:uncharacterized protein LOC111866815 isoform X2 [Cryptotermes secundus]